MYPHGQGFPKETPPARRRGVEAPPVDFIAYGKSCRLSYIANMLWRERSSRAGEIIGWRFWKLRDGLLYSVFVPYPWRPGVFERSSSKQWGFKNLGYHAFRDKEQAEREAIKHACWSPAVIGSVAMWGEVIEHQHGWRSEYAAVRSLIKITGETDFSSKQRLLLDLREKYRCTDSDRTISDAAITVLGGESAGQSGKDSRWKSS